MDKDLPQHWVQRVSRDAARVETRMEKDTEAHQDIPISSQKEGEQHEMTALSALGSSAGLLKVFSDSDICSSLEDRVGLHVIFIISSMKNSAARRFCF